MLFELFNPNPPGRSSTLKMNTHLSCLLVMFINRLRRTIGASPRNEGAQLFANVAGEKTKAEMLTLYHDISALPLKKRRASFRNVSSIDKSDLWRTDLALFFVKHPNLNEWHKEMRLKRSACQCSIASEYCSIWSYCNGNNN